MSSLNKQQYLASLPTRGISLVIAGAGTGKTKIIIEKVKNIISDGIAKPQEILILTFSNKAAEEIKDRVNSGKKLNTHGINSGTFHSFCLSLLKNNSDTFLSLNGFKSFPDVIDEQEKVKLQKNLLISSIDRFLGLPVDVVSGLLNKRLDKRTQKKLNSLGIIGELENLEQRFRSHKISSNLIDFDDMMRFATDMLSNNISIRTQTINKYKYILIDEFQDTSEQNLKLINLIINTNEPNLFLVGDDWQSIYGFRGSRIDYMVNPEKYFPGAVVFKLNTNYRSKKEIVKLSNKFIKKNKYRTGKKLKAAKGRGGILKSFCVKNFEEEVQVIRNIIENLENNNINDIALLYRNNWQGDYLKKKLDTAAASPASLKYMTMHSSKGLEFDNVIIAGISDDIIPDASVDIEEERRLLYVAMTRARNNLYIVHHKPDDGELSLFANELGLAKS
jgi:DNA helicase II / ATP-dependent DNA helicase PcrA